MIDAAAREVALSHLGVMQWYSRKTLQGASESPEFVGLVDKTAVVSDLKSQNSFPPKPERSVQSDTSARSILSELKEVSEVLDSRPAKMGASNSMPSSVLARVEKIGPAFGASIEQISYRLFNCAGVMVLSESQVDFPPQKESELLSNILMACGLPSGQSALLAGFNWPVFGAEKLKPDSNSKLGALLERWLSDFYYFQTPVAFLMGASLLQFEELLSKDKRQVIKLDNSLLDLINMPAKKALVWRQLQPAIPTLKAHV